ncbi:tetratricopeptide repeat protein [Lacimicrobium sp. SS2-24]|uniref:SirB1 family protein n=1 Tax=Lacimicrobium sp. SS2-24 TaxID=2005569 RepID=UPI000B4B3EA6|nr:tetratricopeptide repeat protein [Lacimicrobium sp. SS2-24]
MKRVLEKALEENDLLLASLLVTQHLGMDRPLSTYLAIIERWQRRAQQRVDQSAPLHQQVTQLNQFFYTELAFAGQPKNLLAPDYARMDQVMLYRNGCSVCLSILYCHLARAIGLDATGVSCPGHFFVSVPINEQQSVLLDALSGESVTWEELERRYHGFEDSDQTLALDDLIVAPANSHTTLVRLLHNLKQAYVGQEQYQSALMVSDLLVSLNPEDPYERKGRGWLLQQLNCYAGALADYRYYIRTCPQDPASHLLKLQLRNHNPRTEVLH